MGSEYISTIYEAFSALRSVNATEANQVIPLNHPLLAIFNAYHSPMLISVEGLSAETLRTEQGESIESQLDVMINLRDQFGDEALDDLWGQFNFESIVPIDSELLTYQFIGEEESN